MLKFKLAFNLFVVALLLSACNTSNCVNCIKNPNDSGEGSLRDIVGSSQSGVIVEFDSKISNSTLVLESTIVIKDKEITLKGNGHITLSGGSKVRIFEIKKGGVLRLSGINLENGFSGNYIEDENGGAILNDGELYLDNVKVNNNTAKAGGGIVNYGSLQAENSIFENNATQLGPSGALANLGSANINNSSFINNKSVGGGGAIAHVGFLNKVVKAELIITESTFINNYAELGGGALMLDEGKIKVQGNTFKENKTDGSGGAINAFTIVEFKEGRGELVIENNTFTNNTAVIIGGAVSINSPPYEVSIRGNHLVNNQTSDLGGGGGIAFWSPKPKKESLSLTGEPLPLNHMLTNDNSLFNSLQKVYSTQVQTIHDSLLQSTNFLHLVTNKSNASTPLQQTQTNKESVKIQYNTFYSNNAFSGGAINIALQDSKKTASEFLIENNTFYQNKSLFGGGLNINIDPFYKMRIINNSIVNNQAGQLGGGIYFWNSDKLSENVISMTELQGNVLAENVSSKDIKEAEIPSHDIYSEKEIKPISLGYNLISQHQSFNNFEPHKTDIINTRAQLAELADNGGDTMSLLPKPQSPVIDYIPVIDCLLKNDQRKINRPRDGDGDGVAKCDIGAVEF